MKRNEKSKKRKTILCLGFTVVLTGILAYGICIGMQGNPSSGYTYTEEERERRKQEYMEQEVEKTLNIVDWTGREEEREMYREKMLRLNSAT